MPVATRLESLDLRTLSAEDRAALVEKAFDALAPGESAVFVDSGNAAAAHEWLRRNRRGAFDWSPLGEGNGLFRVQVTRRPEGARIDRRVTEALGFDHFRLDGLEQAAFAALRAGDHAEAGRLFGEFRFGLERHIGFEEVLLFPLVEERLGFPPTMGPTAVMRLEHREILALLAAMADAHAAADLGRVSSLRDELRAVLGGHNEKEEGVLYPGADDALDPKSADQFVAEIQLFTS